MAGLRRSPCWLLVAASWVQAMLASSSVLQRAQLCIINEGVLDMYSSQERCLLDPSSCPVGSEEAHRMCVAPADPGWAREVALTVHVPCDQCVLDQGMELAGHVWLGLARLLRIPLQETVAGVLLMDSELRSSTPLEYFTLRRMGEAPLASHTPTIGPQIAAWDLFIAFRIHTARVKDNDMNLFSLRNRDAGRLEQVMGISSGVYIFEYGDRPTAWVRPPVDLHADFKVRGHGWNQRPSVATPVPTPSPQPPPGWSQGGNEHYCPCSATYVGNGICETPCNIEACGHDGGDCAAKPPPHTAPAQTPRPTTTPRSTTTVRTTTTQRPCECSDVYLRKRDCNTYCNFVACGFFEADDGECLGGGSVIDPVEPTTRSTTTAWTQTRPPVGSPHHWLTAPRTVPAPTPMPTPAPALRGSQPMDAPVVPGKPGHGDVGGAYSLHLEPDKDDPNSWRVVASDEPKGEPSWFADGLLEEPKGGAALPLPLIIGILCSALLMLAVVCVFAKKAPRKQRRSILCEPEHSQQCWGKPAEDMEDGYWDPNNLPFKPAHSTGSFGHHSSKKRSREHKVHRARSESKCSTASTRSAFSAHSFMHSDAPQDDYWDPNEFSIGSTRSSGSFSSYSSKSGHREAKVHPEPEPEDPATFRNTRGGWRSPSKPQPPPKRTPVRTATWQEPQPEPAAAEPGGWAGPPQPRRRANSAEPASPSAKDAAAAAAAAATGGRRYSTDDAQKADNARRATPPGRARVEPEKETPSRPSQRSRSEPPARNGTWQSGPRQAPQGAGAPRAPEAPAPPPRPPQRPAAGQPSPPSGSQAGTPPQRPQQQQKPDSPSAKKGNFFSGSSQQRGQSVPTPSGKKSGGFFSRSEPQEPSASAKRGSGQNEDTQQRAQSEPPPSGKKGGFFSRWRSTDKAAGSPQQQQPKAGPKPPEPPHQRPQAAPKPKAQPKAQPKPQPQTKPSHASSRTQEEEKRTGWPWGSQKKTQPPTTGRHFQNQVPKEKDPEKKAGSMVADVLRELEQTRAQPLEARKKVFKDLQRRLHPDKNLHCPEAAKLAFQQLMENRSSYLAA